LLRREVGFRAIDPWWSEDLLTMRTKHTEEADAAMAGEFGK
jgi:hypothetical protein